MANTSEKNNDTSGDKYSYECEECRDRLTYDDVYECGGCQGYKCKWCIWHKCECGLDSKENSEDEDDEEEEEEENDIELLDDNLKEGG
jgi:hypothetical protein